MSDCTLCDVGIPTKEVVHLKATKDGEPCVLAVSPKAAETISLIAKHQKFLKDAKEELYTAIQALEDGDLPYARSSSIRASGLIVEAHQILRKISVVDPIE